MASRSRRIVSMVCFASHDDGAAAEMVGGASENPSDPGSRLPILSRLRPRIPARPFFIGPSRTMASELSRTIGRWLVTSSAQMRQKL